jgi:hypothetical protein
VCCLPGANTKFSYLQSMSADHARVIMTKKDALLAWPHTHKQTHTQILWLQILKRHTHFKTKPHEQAVQLQEQGNAHCLHGCECLEMTRSTGELKRKRVRERSAPLTFHQRLAKSFLYAHTNR